MNLGRSARAVIQNLNDAFRAGGPAGGDWLVTVGVQLLGPHAVAAAVMATMQFDAFTSDNDPHGEHDFGSFVLGSEKLYWKIDYYDRNLEFGSPDPSDEQLTRRVITILLASEY